jgi:hypothetical protein
MKINADSLLSDLKETTTHLLNEAELLQQKPISVLNWKENQDSWSVLECLEHLNLYGDFYLVEIEKSIKQAKNPAEPIFKSGMLGNYFAESMIPKAKLNKMKTFKDKNPINSKLDKKVIDRFMQQQKQLFDLLEKARLVSLNTTKTSISISKWVKLKLGDTFRFFINHQIRHFKQIENLLKNE